MKLKSDQWIIRKCHKSQTRKHSSIICHYGDNCELALQRWALQSKHRADDLTLWDDKSTTLTFPDNCTDTQFDGPKLSHKNHASQHPIGWLEDESLWPGRCVAALAKVQSKQELKSRVYCCLVLLPLAKYLVTRVLSFLHLGTASGDNSPTPLGWLESHFLFNRLKQCPHPISEIRCVHVKCIQPVKFLLSNTSSDFLVMFFPHQRNPKLLP